MNNIFPVIIITLYICAAVWDSVNINLVSVILAGSRVGKCRGADDVRLIWQR